MHLVWVLSGFLPSLLPLGLGHALAIGAVVALAAPARVVVPVAALRVSAAAILFGFGLYRLFRRKHPRWGGMRVDFKDLTIWSFIMASAHGAGLMVLPVVLAMPAGGDPGHAHHGALHAGMMPDAAGGLISLFATALHTLAYLAVAGVVAVTVYEKLGLSLLRQAWINLDLIWAIALIATGCFVLLGRAALELTARTSAQDAQGLAGLTANMQIPQAADKGFAQGMEGTQDSVSLDRAGGGG